MSFARFLLLVVAALASACAPPDASFAPGFCRPGAHFIAPDGCNSCTCPPSGVEAEAECTEMACAVRCVQNADCGETEFCRFSVLGVCPQNRGDYLGACEKRPQVCPRGGAGVCGCGGETAQNECQLRMRGVNVAPCPN